MKDDKQKFGRLRAKLSRAAGHVKRWLTGATDKPQHGYSGDKSRPHVARERRYLHKSVTFSEIEEVTVQHDHGPYVRTELRRHELRRLKRRFGLDLSGSTGTRAFEYLLKGN